VLTMASKPRHRTWRRTTQGRAKDLVSNALKRDKEKGFKSPRVIDWEDVAALIEAGKCEVTGVTFDLAPPNKDRRVNPQSPSIDKLDHRKPYVPNRGPRNWRLVTTVYNLGRQQLSDQDLAKLIVDPIILSRGVIPWPEYDPRHWHLNQLGQAIKQQMVSRLLIPFPAATAA
jgi:hypothetical protein